MTSFRQIEANRRNARLSTGPGTEEGKRKSRQNAVRHGLTAETVIDALEDVEDYAAFEMAVTADYDAQSAVERELVLRLASLLWRLRRATAIEVGYSRSRRNNYFSSENGDERIATTRRLSMKCIGMPSWPKTSYDRIRMTLPLTARPRPRRLPTNRTSSRSPLSACPTCQPIPSIG